MRSKKLIHIVVDESNYLRLKQLGNTGDSFNDVITSVLRKLVENQTQEEVVTR